MSTTHLTVNALLSHLAPTLANYAQPSTTQMLVSPAKPKPPCLVRTPVSATKDGTPTSPPETATNATRPAAHVMALEPTNVPLATEMLHSTLLLAPALATTVSTSVDSPRTASLATTTAQLVTDRTATNA